MLVIIDGPDCSGKTTLAQGLHKVFEVPTVKFVVPRDSQELLGRIQRTLEHGMTTPVILDRWHFPADFIYTHIVENRKSQLVPYKYDIINWLREKKAMYLHIIAPVDVLIKRHEEQMLLDGSDYIRTEHLGQILTAYTEWMAELEDEGIPVKQIDSSYYDQDELLLIAGIKIIEVYSNFAIEERIRCK